MFAADMIGIHDNLHQQFCKQMDGKYDEEEEMFLRQVAKSYAFCENSIAVLSNMHTDCSHIYFGRTGEILGLAKEGDYRILDSVCEEEVFLRVHPDDLRLRCLQELAFFRVVSTSHSADAFAWRMENTMRMMDSAGRYHPVLHRISYFPSKDSRGVSYALCLYNLTAELSSTARLVNTATGEQRKLDVEKVSLLSEREKTIIRMIDEGQSSKIIAHHLNISKHTVDRHRQNIIQKLQTSSTIEACHKARNLGLIE